MIEKLCWICFESSQVPVSRADSRSSRSQPRLDTSASSPSTTTTTTTTTAAESAVVKDDASEDNQPAEYSGLNEEEEPLTEDEDAEQGQPANSDVFIAPCQCSGDTKYVHASCLMRWIVRKQVEARQAGKAHPDVRCPQCRSIYLISMGKGIASSFPGRYLIQSIVRLRQGHLSMPALSFFFLLIFIGCDD